MDGTDFNRTAAEDALTDTAAPDHSIDITTEICPMTFVRTRLALDLLAEGAILSIRLSGEEPRRNVPATARRLGHEILSEETAADGVTTLLLRKGIPAGSHAARGRASDSTSASSPLA